MMLRFLSSEKYLPVSIDDATSRYEAPRPCSSTKVENRYSMSSISSSHYSRLSRDSMTSRRSSVTSYSSISSYGSNFDTVPTLTKTPWELDRHKRNSLSRRTRRSAGLSAHFFQKLPREVYDCILQQLELLHFHSGAHICPSCYLRDMHNLALTSRAWDIATREKLYRNVWILIDDAPHDLKKLKIKTASRLKLLRRTLRERTALAKYVRELIVPDFQELYQNVKGSEKLDVIDMMSSVVMACPNLKKLSGFYIPYDHNFDRLSHALSTRRNLKEHVWLLENSRRIQITPDGDKTNSEFYFPHNDPTEIFLQHSDHWSSLSTLILHSQNPGCMNFRSFIATFRKLPSLQHLLLSNFSSSEFTDQTLHALPPLHSLRLQDLPGLTDKGLLRFANSHAAKTLRSLLLIDLEIMHLPVLTKFISNLPLLRRFTLVQDGSPALFPGAVLARPIFRSTSLEFLHWDILVPGAANEDLAESIATGAFPKLRTLRSPSDHDGLLQDVCRPLAQIAQPCDAHPDTQIHGSETHYVRSLSAARVAAQERIEDARKRAGMKIIVEEDGVVQHTYTMRAFMGRIGSRIEYSLEPDVEGAESAVVSVEELMKGQRVDEDKGGRWNRVRKGCLHFGRERRRVQLGMFF